METKIKNEDLMAFEKAGFDDDWDDDDDGGDDDNSDDDDDGWFNLIYLFFKT